jgi:hypothetical protein
MRGPFRCVISGLTLRCPVRSDPSPARGSGVTPARGERAGPAGTGRGDVVIFNQMVEYLGGLQGAGGE